MVQRIKQKSLNLLRHRSFSDWIFNHWKFNDWKFNHWIFNHWKFSDLDCKTKGIIDIFCFNNKNNITLAYEHFQGRKGGKVRIK